MSSIQEKEITKLKKELENEKQDFAKFQSGALEYDIQWYQCDKCNKYKFDGYDNCMDTVYGEICVECYKEQVLIKEEKEIAEFDTDNLDTALYQDNCDWSFDKPINKPYHTIYIFDKEEE